MPFFRRNPASADAPAEAVATRQTAVGDSFTGPVARQLLVAIAAPAQRKDRGK